MSTKKFFKAIVSLALVLVVTVGGVFGVMAALSTNVKSAFQITYTAHNVNARVIGQFSQSGNPREKFGEDIVFSGEESNAVSRGFPNKSFVLDGPNDVLEVYYSIFNNSEKNCFAVTMNLSGLTLTNFDVKYSFIYWAGPSEEDRQAGNYLAGAPVPSFTRTVSPQQIYLTPKGTEACCALIAMQFRVSDVEKNASISGFVNFDMDGEADAPMAELFDSQTQKFDEATFNKILQKISGDDTVSAQNMSKIDQMASAENEYDIAGSDSADFRKNNNGKNIVISLGGLTWHVCYLSKAKGENGENDGDTILTIWLSSSQQEAWDGRTADEGKYFGFINGGLCSRYSAWWNSRSPYPSGFYSTSYVRAATLNNGGSFTEYVQSHPVTVTLSEPYEKSSENVFALFTMPEFGLTDFIVTPRNVAWQECGLFAKEIFEGFPYNLANDNWTTDLTKVPDEEFYSNSLNYSNFKENEIWADDFLWLPALTEVGCGVVTNYDGISCSGNGLWQLDQDQRKNVTQINWGNFKKVGYRYQVPDDAQVGLGLDNSTYLRSVRCGGALRIPFSGNGFMDMYRAHSNAYAIRPALHLNLTKIAQALVQKTN